MHVGGFEKARHIEMDRFRMEADHVLVEFNDAGLAVAVASVIHESATVVIDESGGVEEPGGTVV